MKQPLYTVQVPGPKKAGETRTEHSENILIILVPYRNINAPHQLMTDTPERVRTLYENFQHGLKLSANDVLQMRLPFLKKLALFRVPSS